MRHLLLLYIVEIETLSTLSSQEPVVTLDAAKVPLPPIEVLLVFTMLVSVPFPLRMQEESFTKQLPPCCWPAMRLPL